MFAKGIVVFVVLVLNVLTVWLLWASFTGRIATWFCRKDRQPQ